MTSRISIRVIAALWAVTAAIPVASGAQDGAPRFNDVRLSTGLRMHYAESGADSAEPIILLHGLSDSWFSFSRVIAKLGARHRVYALDQRGHGDSDRPRSGYQVQDLAADVVAFMDAKRIVRATIVGHSMGSFVAQYVALAAPKRVSRLVLVGSATAPRQFAGLKDFTAVVDSLPDPVPAAFLREFQVSTVYQGVSSEFIDRAVTESAKLPARVWRELMAGLLAADRPIALGMSGIPTLVMWGDKDTYALRAEQDALVALIRSASLKAYPNTGHSPHWERPATFSKDLLKFVEK